MLNKERKAMYRANENLFEIIKIVFDSDNELSADLRKLIYYQNTTEGIAEPLQEEDISYNELFLKSVYPYKHIDNIQDSGKTYMNIYYDSFYINTTDKSRRIEKGYLCVDILTHKDMELIVLDGQFAVRKYEIMNRIRKIFDGNKNIPFLNGLNLYYWGEYDSPSTKHTGLRLMFDIIEIT